MNLIIILSLIHAVVDMSCASMLFNYYDSHKIMIDYLPAIFILYDTLAFGTQFLIGFLTDIFKRPILIALIGIGLLILGMIFGNYTPLLAVCLMGLGNAAFHIGGGYISLTYKANKAFYPGFFVAPGAIGLFAGIWLGKNHLYSPIILIISLIILSAFLLLVHNKPQEVKTNLNQNISDKNKNLINTAIILFLFSIIIRSFIGFSINIPWKTNINLMFILTLFIAFGKLLGGWFGDKFGWMKISVISLITSAILLSVGFMHPFLILTGFFLFNFTMPIAIVALAGLLPNRAGFAFGLNCLALLFGSSIKLFDSSFVISSFLVPVVILISATAMLIGLKLYNKILEKDYPG